jgi:Putative capsular polysaccharide synthesis protein
MHFVKRLLGRLAAKNYALSKTMWMRAQRQKLQECKAEPIINYQMGKVGSSTVQASLEARNPGCPVYHVHFLNPRRVSELESQRRKYFATGRYGYLRRSWLYQFLLEEIQRQRRHWKLITMVREPIARNISTFFENLDVKVEPGSTLYKVRSDYYGFDIDVDLNNVEPLTELFFDRLVHERPLRYFDDEVKTVFGIDVFASEFPQQEGYQILKGGNADLLVIRLDDLDRCAEQAFSDFLGIDGFRLRQTNVGGEKNYAPLYKEFQRKICLPQDYIERMYTSRYARHFYSQDELHQFAGKWGGANR